MRSRLGRRTGAGAALVLAILVAAPASPAAAEAVITITSPAENAVLDSGTVVVKGTAEVPPPTLGIPLSTLETVTITIGDKTVTAANCSGKTSCTYQATFELPLNGPKTVAVVAKPTGLLPHEASKESRSFAVAAPPARPVLDAPKVTGSRHVELSWSRNPEPDTRYYAVFRKDPGASTFLRVSGAVEHPRVTFVDTTTSGLPAGDYTYQVVAVRRGVTDSAADEIASAASAARAVAVPAPPTAVPAPGTPAAGPGTTVKPGPPAGVDLSGFLSSRAQPVTVAPITVPEPPDTGFSGTLPFGAALPSEELEEGEAEAVPPRDARGSSVVSLDAGRPLVPVAAGLVLLLLAMHLRVLGRKVKAPADHDLAVDLAPHTPAAAVPIARPTDDHPPGQDLYDIEAEATMAPDTDWEADWAAQVPEPEPMPAAEVEPEPVPEPEPIPEPEPVPVVEVEPEPVPVPQPELDVVELWAPPEPEPPAYDPDEIEIVEVVSSTRRPLARAGAG